MRLLHDVRRHPPVPSGETRQHAGVLESSRLPDPRRPPRDHSRVGFRSARTPSRSKRGGGVPRAGAEGGAPGNHGRRATLSVQTATRRDGGGGGVTTGSYPNHQRYGGSGHTTTTKTEKDGPSGTADSGVGGAETKRSQDSSEYGERRTSGANGHTSRTKSRRSGHGENDDGAGANATDGGDTSEYTQTSESEARATTAG